MTEKTTATGWQPIETAPKEPRDKYGYGPPILLFQATGDGDDSNRTIAIGQWGVWEHGPKCWCMEAGDGWMAPTHWMPLPTPPCIMNERAPQPTDPAPDLADLIQRAKAAYEAMTPEQRGEMHAAQRRGYVITGAAMGDDRDESEYRAAIAIGDQETIDRLHYEAAARAKRAEQWLKEHGL